MARVHVAVPDEVALQHARLDLSVAADNALDEVRLNGVVKGQTHGGFGTLAAIPTVQSADLVVGDNVLDFHVERGRPRWLSGSRRLYLALVALALLRRTRPRTHR